MQDTVSLILWAPRGTARGKQRPYRNRSYGLSILLAARGKQRPYRNRSYGLSILLAARGARA